MIQLYSYFYFYHLNNKIIFKKFRDCACESSSLYHFQCKIQDHISSAHQYLHWPGPWDNHSPFIINILKFLILIYQSKHAFYLQEKWTFIANGQDLSSLSKNGKYISSLYWEGSHGDTKSKEVLPVPWPQ